MTVLQIETPAKLAPLLRPARYKGAHGGRGSGKSHFFASLMLESHLLDHGTRSVCVREVQKSLSQSVKRLLEDQIAKLNAGAYFTAQDALIKSHGPAGGEGGIILFQGMQNHTSDSIKSLEGYSRAWVEEAQSLSQRSLDLLRPTIREDGSELWFSWNPASEDDPVDAFLRKSPPPGSIVVEVNYQDNPWFPDVLRQEMEYDRGRDPDRYGHVWCGGYLQHTEARVFRNWRVEEFDAPSDALFRFGADWGFATDPTVLVRSYQVGRALYVDYEAYMVGCEIVDTPDLFGTVPESTRWPIIADSARPETISHMRSHGYPKIMPAVKGPKSVEEGIEWLKSCDIVVHPRCKHVIDELSLYRYKTDAGTGAVLPILEDKDNHTIDALRYSCEGLRRVTPRRTGNVVVMPSANYWSAMAARR